jgi:hypothetical protein
MKRTNKTRTALSSMAAAGALALTLATSPAMAFVDYDHSAEGVHDSATRYTGSPMPSGGFIDYDHSASAKPSESKTIDGHMKTGNCGFIDCDHTASHMGS